jgi:hypothetical protein
MHKQASDSLDTCVFRLTTVACLLGCTCVCLETGDRECPVSRGKECLEKLCFVSPDRTYAGDHRAARTPPGRGRFVWNPPTCGHKYNGLYGPGFINMMTPDDTCRRFTSRVRGGVLSSLGGFVIRIRILMYPACIRIHIRIHQDTCILDCSSRYIRIHRDTKSRYMYLGRDTIRNAYMYLECIQRGTYLRCKIHTRNKIHSGYMYLQR